MEQFQPRRILAATDFSHVATHALRHAVAIAKKFGARISVIYAEPFLSPVEGPVDFYFDNIPRMKEALEKRLLAYTDTHVGPADTDVVVDMPAGAIVSTADRINADLIVMGTHGRKGIRHAILGSVAESVVHETNRPVLTVHTLGGQEVPEEPPMNTIFCPVNFTDVARKALEHAAVLATAFGSKLVVLHVVERAEELEDGGDLVRLRAWIPESLRQQFDYRKIMLTGHAAGPIIDFARSVSADMMVIGAQHRRFADTTVVGTTSERLIRHSPCPVLTVIRGVETGKPEEIEEPLEAVVH